MPGKLTRNPPLRCPLSSFVVAGTPEEAITYYWMLVEAGIEYFVVETLAAADEETIRLLAEKVVPAVNRRK